jgi:hypothetical protein
MAACFTAVMDGPHDATMLVLDAPPSPDNDPSSWYVAADALADHPARGTLQARPIRLGPRRPLTTSLSLATSAQRPRGPLLEQASALLVQLARGQVPGAA